jgi:hypothetical protein
MMDKQEFGQLFFNSLTESARNAEERLGKPIVRAFEIELHGAGYSGMCFTPDHALDALFLDENHSYRIIDIAVIEIHPAQTRIFVRASAHRPSSFEKTWNQPPGAGPFKQILAEDIRVFDT